MAFSRYDFYKERYDFEIELGEKLKSAINTPITLTILLGSAVIYFYENHGWVFVAVVDYLFVALFSLALLSLVGSLVFLLILFLDKDRAKIARSERFVQWEEVLGQNIVVDNDTLPPEALRSLVNAEFEEGLISRYVQVADFNRSQNDAQQLYLNRVKFLIVCTIGALVACTVIHFISVERSETVHKVRLVSIE